MSVTLFQENPSPVAIVVAGDDGRMRRVDVGESLDAIRPHIGEPIYEAPLEQWGTLTANVRVMLFPAGQKFKINTALVFSEGKLAVIGRFEESKS